MDKITKYGLYDYKQFSFEDLIKKYDIGIDSDVMVKEFERLLPDIDKMGWWTEGKQGHQAQFAIQSRKDSDNPYYESCGPQPHLNKEYKGYTLTEGSYDTTNEMFKDTYFENILNMFPFPVCRVRFVRLSSKACYRFHRDMTYKFHIPLVTNPSNVMIWPEQSHRIIVHMPADGYIYFTETAISHTALNGGQDYRYHIVVSSMVDREEIFNNLNEKQFDETNYPSLTPEGEWK
tara:strand:+ start:1288 stop:1986 length:699 start_codon:yes stop_codon:yes gene_type:complete